MAIRAHRGNPASRCCRTRAAGGDVQRQTGLRSHAQSLGHVDFHRHHDTDVPEHFHVCAHSDGRIAGGSGLAGRRGRQTDSTRRFEFIAGERCDCRCRRGDCFCVVDRPISNVGLHEKSFIPMLSSYACAIPGIMATRTIETPKDRLVTILVAPLMSCSARLPIYTLLIAACIPDIKILGWLKLQGLTMLAMYLLGTVVALLMAWLFKKTLLKGETPMLIMELPPYKRPLLRVVARHMWDRSRLFLRRAGTVILGINILLWFLATGDFAT